MPGKSGHPRSNSNAWRDFASSVNTHRHDLWVPLLRLRDRQNYDRCKIAYTADFQQNRVNRDQRVPCPALPDTAKQIISTLRKFGNFLRIASMSGFSSGLSSGVASGGGPSINRSRRNDLLIAMGSFMRSLPPGASTRASRSWVTRATCGEAMHRPRQYRISAQDPLLLPMESR